MEQEKIIEVLIRALGTMVMIPEYESDPDNIGKKLYKGNIQKPILEGTNRQIAEEKLIEIVKSLKNTTLTEREVIAEREVNLLKRSYISPK